MNFQECQRWVSIIKDIVTAIATIIAAVVAIVGLYTWKKQLTGKTNYEMARRLLKAVYKLRNAIRLVRNTWMSNAEMSHAIKETGIHIEQNDTDTRVKSATAVYQIRWNKISEAISDLEVEALEAKVSLGNEVENRIARLIDCVSQLNLAINEHLDRLKGLGTGMSNEQINQILNEYNVEPKENPFTTRINKCVDEIETLLKQYLQP